MTIEIVDGEIVGGFYSAVRVACPQDGQTVKIARPVYTEPVYFKTSFGSVTEPPRLVAWMLTCGHSVSGVGFTLYVPEWPPPSPGDGPNAFFREQVIEP